MELCYERRSVGQSILVSSAIWGPRPDFCYCQLWVYRCVAPCLTRGRVCHLQSLLVLINAVILAFKSCCTHDHILLSQIRDYPNLENQVPVFISSRDRVAQLHPLAQFFLLPPVTRRVTVEVFEPGCTQAVFQ
jgi:hypothetical protein